MKEDGKKEENIEKEINRYYLEYNCATIKNETLNSTKVILKDGYWQPYPSCVMPEYYFWIPPETQPFYSYALDNYALMYDVLMDGFTEYVQLNGSENVQLNKSPNRVDVTSRRARYWQDTK